MLSLERKNDVASAVSQHCTNGAETVKRVNQKNLKSMGITMLSVALALVVVFGSCKKDNDKLVTKNVAESSIIHENDFDVNAKYLCGGGDDGDFGSIGVWYFNPRVPNDVRDIFTRTLDGQKRFTSFCAFLGAGAFGSHYNADWKYVVKQNFGSDEYYVEANLAKVTAAFNYIYNNYGKSIDKFNRYSLENVNENTKVLSQLVVWTILNGLEWTSEFEEVSQAGFTQRYRIALQDVMANYQGATGPIVKSYLLVGEQYPDNVLQCQPQLVPVWNDTPQDDFCVELFDCNAGYGYQSTLWNYPLTDPFGLGAYFLFRPNMGCSNLNAQGDMMAHNLKDGNNTLFVSYCANNTSGSIGTTTYRVEKIIKDPKLLAAFNYIYKKYGGSATEAPDMTRVLGQIFVWHLYCKVDLDCMTENLPQEAEKYQRAVADVKTNCRGEGGIGDIVAFAYLVGPNYPNDIATHQPQLVPLCEDPTCDVWLGGQIRAGIKAGFARANYPTQYAMEVAIYEALVAYDNGKYAECETPPVPVYGSAYGSVTATTPNQWGLKTDPNVIAAKNGNAIHTKDKLNPLVVPNSNHFTYAKLCRQDLANGVELVMVVGNKFDNVGKAFVQLVGGQLAITIINGKGAFSAIAFGGTTSADNFAKGNFPKNGNIHSQKAADLEKAGAVKGQECKNNNNVKFGSETVTIPCPDGKDIYLYIHGDFSFIK